MNCRKVATLNFSMDFGMQLYVIDRYSQVRANHVQSLGEQATFPKPIEKLSLAIFLRPIIRARAYKHTYTYT